MTNLHNDLMNAVSQSKSRLENVARTFLNDLSNYLSLPNAIAKHITIEADESYNPRNIYFTFPDFAKKIQLHDQLTWQGGGDLELILSLTNPSNGNLIVSFAINPRGETIVHYPGEEPYQLGVRIQHGHDAFLSCVVSGCLKAKLFQ
ncbi:hypothetical protein [Siccibacter colletis]|uniref:Uncharacterized protein n=1 Tax=Siccibacter colletis TaxID=1505757 RepID=A0ABY6J9R8_9ENTR|nr:hypothetical protein [Siccibacter colletis]UYU30514.1 hypothetical protein KFZ77_11505 [Siccibacter colletis]